MGFLASQSSGFSTKIEGYTFRNMKALILPQNSLQYQKYYHLHLSMKRDELTLSFTFKMLMVLSENVSLWTNQFFPNLSSFLLSIVIIFSEQTFIEESGQILKVLIACEKNTNLKMLSILRLDRKRFIGRNWHITDKTLEVLKERLCVKFVTLHGWMQMVVIILSRVLAKFSSIYYLFFYNRNLLILTL